MKLQHIFLVFLLLYTCFECGAFPLPDAEGSQPAVIAHRGDSAHAPENTLPAVELAIRNGADMIELDIRETADGVLIAMHDTPPLHLPQSRSICTLEQTLRLCKGRTRLLLDLKVSGIEQKVVSLIRRYDLESSCEICSKHPNVLRHVKQTNPDITTLMLISDFSDTATRLCRTSDLGALACGEECIDGYSIRSCLITASLVRFVHRQNKRIYAWTVNSPAELRRMQRLSVDGIITDDPAFAMPDKTRS